MREYRWVENYNENMIDMPSGMPPNKKHTVSLTVEQLYTHEIAMIWQTPIEKEKNISIMGIPCGN